MEAVMRALPIAFLIGLIAIPAWTATITEEEIAIQYSYPEAVAASQNQDFKLVLRGNPFGTEPARLDAAVTALVTRNLPLRATRVTTSPANGDRRPDYRIVLLFNPAGTVPNWRLCDRLDDQAATAPQGRTVTVAAAYCRNDVALTSARASTQADGLDDPALNALFNQLLAVLFPRFDPIRPHIPRDNFR
jgi:hypothetical protein